MYYGHYGYPMMGDWGWGIGNFFGGILQVIFWIFIIALIIRVVRGRSHWRRWMSNDALSILRERYAKGEISKEEYEERKKVLTE